MLKMTKSSALDLHKKYVQGVDKENSLDLVWIHSEIVTEIALKIVTHLNTLGIKPNKHLVEMGGLLHDIGVYGCFDEDFNQNNKLPKYILHGEVGYEWLKNEKVGEKVARFALTHTGTGITSEDILREKLPFKLGDYIPVTLEEEIVCYADKFHTKSPRFCNFAEQREKLGKFDPAKMIIMDRFKQKFGVLDLSDIELKYAKWHEKLRMTNIGISI